MANDGRHARRDEEEEPAGVSGMDARKECFRFVSKTVCNHVTMSMYQRNIVKYDHQESITLKKNTDNILCHKYLLYFDNILKVVKQFFLL